MASVVALLAFLWLAAPAYAAGDPGGRPAVTAIHAAVSQGPVTPLTLAALENFTYDLGGTASVEGGQVPLSGGRWADTTGGSTFRLHPAHAFGDLDGDRVADAVVVLVEETGGSGTFFYLFAIRNDAGTPVQLGEPEWLGDRSIVERVAIDRRGVLSVRYVTHRESDPSCCPTLRIDDRYKVEQGRLVGLVK